MSAPGLYVPGWTLLWLEPHEDGSTALLRVATGLRSRQAAVDQATAAMSRGPILAICETRVLVDVIAGIAAGREVPDVPLEIYGSQTRAWISVYRYLRARGFQATAGELSPAEQAIQWLERRLPKGGGA